MRKWISLVALAALVGTPVVAAPSISVTNGAALNGSFGLQVDFDGNGGAAYVQSNHPSSERTMRLDLNINPNNMTMCQGPNCRWYFVKALGNRNGSFENTFALILKNTASGYKVFCWYKDADSGNPGQWEALNSYFVPGNAITKVSVEYTAATDGNADGTVSLYKNDVLFDSESNVGTRYEVDQVRLGHVNGAVKAGALGSFYADDYVTTRF